MSLGLSKPNSPIRYALGVFEAFLERSGRPQDQLPPVIHIAGTNGKGSVTTYLAAALQSAGLRVGTFTSPHLVSITERFTLNGSPISEAEFQAQWAALMAMPGADTLTEFERLTALAFRWFSSLYMGKEIDILICEVGLGGRLDATNVVSPILTIITKIGRDHEAILGKSLAKIAGEKAGIIKPGIPVVTLNAQAPSVAAVIRKRAKDLAAPYHSVHTLSRIPRHYRMQGDYQRQNLALARGALALLSPSLGALNPQKLEAGLALAFIPGRLECVQEANPRILLDAAHNVPGVLALLSHLKRHYPGVRPVFIVGIYAPKNGRKMLEKLVASGEVYYCEFDPELAWPYAEVLRYFPEVKPFSWQREDLAGHDLVVMTGSIYFLGFALHLLEVVDHF